MKINTNHHLKDSHLNFKQIMKIKTHVITISKTFPAYHSRKGQETGFKEKLLSGEKIHTIRGNYDYWRPKIYEVIAGVAVLSIRQWSDKPYKSKQVVIAELTGNQVGIQKVIELQVKRIGNAIWNISVGIENADIDFQELTKNDGLSEYDICEWFGKGIKNGCIIHFTDFIYK